MAPRSAAIDLAMEARQRPGLLAQIAAGPLPAGMKTLIRIAADGAVRDGTTEHVYGTHSTEAVHQAATAFLSAVLFTRTAEPHRILGLAPSATEDDVRDHKRFLLKWLHPDRNHDTQLQALFARVVNAADEIEAGSRPAAAADGDTPRERPPAVNVRPRSGGTHGKPRKKAARPSPPPGWDDHAVKARVTQSLRAFGHGLKITAYGTTSLILALLLWRALMEEPIGTSLQRFSQRALAVMSW